MSKFKKYKFFQISFIIVIYTFVSGCGDLSDEEKTQRIQFTEFVLFPTAPYINQSYIEEGFDEDAVSIEINYAVEIQAIKEVYNAFITAYVKEDMNDLIETLDTVPGMEYGTSTVIVHGWHNIRIYIETNWFSENWGTDCDDVVSNPQLIEFFIRPKNVQVPWMEASAKGPMFYYIPDEPICYQDIGEYYFTKKSGKWRIHQIDGSKFFTDTIYKAP